MLEQGVEFVLMNMSLVMYALAAFFMAIHFALMGKRLSQYEIIFRWLALFGLGGAGLYGFIMHAFFPLKAAMSIGWVISPFQYEVAMADLAIGVLGVLSFNARYGFRLATVIASVCYLWGDATGHLYQIVRYQDFAIGNAGSWLWMDILIPLLLLVCIIKLKPAK
jgi:hypothetical protein